MKLELKAIKYAAFNSHETLCYQANLYLNGKKIAEVGNEGHGGCDYQHFISKEVEDDLMFRIHETQPEAQRSGCPLSWLEDWCNDELVTWLHSRDLKKLLKKKVIGVEPDTQNLVAWTSKSGKSETILQSIMARHPDHILLNNLAFSEALELYRELG